MLLTFGDSFTYGEELKELHDAWPYHVSNMTRLSLINHGKPGASNDEILRRLYEEVAGVPVEEIDLVIIAWTSPGRIECADEAGAFSIWPGYNSAKYSKNMPWRGELVAHFSQYHNTEWLCQRYVQNVLSAQMFLKALGIRYVMCDINYNDYYKNLHLCVNTSELLCNALLDTTKYAGWGKEGMAEWVGKVKRGPGGHFLEEGHRIVGRKICEFIKKNKIL